MHHKFTKHGQGKASKAVRYLLQDHDSSGELRAGIEVLRGDPDMVATVADSLEFKRRYTSGVIAWSSEEQPTDKEISAVLDDWERLAFAGIEPQNRCWTAVLHREENGGVHVHTITARVELGTGKALNIAPPGHLRDFDAFRDCWNHGKGWARPDDPARQRSLAPGQIESHRPGNKTEITHYLSELASAGLVTNAHDVKAELAKLGEITRSGKDYISIKPDGSDRAIRLKGGLFSHEWTSESQLKREATAAALRADGRGGHINPGRAAEARSELERAVQRRAEYNQQRYRDPNGANQTPEIGVQSTVPGIGAEPAQPVVYTHGDQHDRRGIGVRSPNLSRHLEQLTSKLSSGPSPISTGTDRTSQGHSAPTRAVRLSPSATSYRRGLSDRAGVWKTHQDRIRRLRGEDQIDEPALNRDRAASLGEAKPTIGKLQQRVEKLREIVGRIRKTQQRVQKATAEACAALRSKVQLSPGASRNAAGGAEREREADNQRFTDLERQRQEIERLAEEINTNLLQQQKKQTQATETPSQTPPDRGPKLG